MQPVAFCLVAYIAGMLTGSFLDAGAPLLPFWFAPFITTSLWFLLRGRRATSFFLLLFTFFSSA